LVVEEYATLCGPRQGQITDPVTGGITGEWRSFDATYCTEWSKTLAA